MRNFLHSRFIIFVVIAVILCVIALQASIFSDGRTPFLTNFVGIIVSPFQKAANGVSGFFDRIHGYIFEFDELQEENERLNAQLREAEAKLREVDHIIEENESMRRLLGLNPDAKDNLELEIAEVIGESIGGISTSLTIDKGSLSGIKQNDCVMTADGMVGFISEVGTTFSVVTLLSDPSMQMGAMISRTREVAVCQGDFVLMRSGKLKLSYLKKDADIMVGDPIETSGLGEVFPKGVLIGYIEEVVPESHGISDYAVIRPAVDLNDLKTVFVVKSFKNEG